MPPSELTSLLSVLRSVPLDAVADLLDVPNNYAGGNNWGRFLLDEAVPLLPPDRRAWTSACIYAAHGFLPLVWTLGAGPR